MKKLIFIKAFLLCVVTTQLFGVHYFAGQKEYLQHCRAKECHGSSSVFVSSYSKAQWSKFLENDGEVLIKKHTNVKDAMEIREYFDSKRYMKKLKYLKAFVYHFASDGKMMSRR